MLIVNPEGWVQASQKAKLTDADDKVVPWHADTDSFWKLTCSSSRFLLLVCASDTCKQQSRCPANPIKGDKNQTTSVQSRVKVNRSGFPLPEGGGDSLLWILCSPLQEQGWVFRAHLHVSQPPLCLSREVRSPRCQVQKFECGKEVQGWWGKRNPFDVEREILHNSMIWEKRCARGDLFWAWNLWSSRSLRCLGNTHVDRNPGWTKADQIKETTVKPSEHSESFFSPLPLPVFAVPLLPPPGSKWDLEWNQFEHVWDLIPTI